MAIPPEAERAATDLLECIRRDHERGELLRLTMLPPEEWTVADIHCAQAVICMVASRMAFRVL